MLYDAEHNLFFFLAWAVKDRCQSRFVVGSVGKGFHGYMACHDATKWLLPNLPCHVHVDLSLNRWQRSALSTSNSVFRRSQLAEWKSGYQVVCVQAKVVRSPGDRHWKCWKSAFLKQASSSVINTMNHPMAASPAIANISMSKLDEDALESFDGEQKVWYSYVGVTHNARNFQL